MGNFDVFLSHNSQDKPTVERIAEKLKRQGLEPWFDKWCVIPGGSWQKDLADGLRASSACAVFVGPGGIGRWEDLEYQVATDRMAKDPDFRVFLVLLPGLPDPFDPNALPPFLSIRTWVDLRQGIDDSPALKGLIHAVKGIPLGPQVPLEPLPGVCPYRGLQFFDEEHAPYFFGRAADVQRLLEKLKGTRFLAVFGPSGSGKSSLVRAGLIPALRRGALPGSETWTILVLRPGVLPITELAAHLLRKYPLQAMQKTVEQMASDESTLHHAVALGKAGSPPDERVVWVIDQFEEIFTLCRDEAQRNRFIGNLLRASSMAEGRCAVILTMRADFYPRCAAHRELASRLAAQQFLISPMDRDNLRQAIQEPARIVGLEYETGLVETILDEVSNQPGVLPLLQHSLLELWKRQRGGFLTLEDYRKSGGVKEAITRTADKIFEEFSPHQKEITQRILLRLTQPGEGTEDTRRRASMNELVTRSEESEEVEKVIGQLVDHRLLTTSKELDTDERWVDVSHEALIRGWKLLREWIEKDRAGLRIHRRLNEAAQEWVRMKRDDGLLYRGARLAEALEWRENNEAALNELERDFLNSSEALRIREKEAERERELRELEAAQRLAATEKKRAEAAQALARSERKARVRQRYFTMGVSVLLVAAVAAAWYAFKQQKISHSRELASAAINQMKHDPELSASLAVTAVGMAQTAEAENILRDALIALHHSHLRALLAGHKRSVRGASFSPDGERIATAGEDHRVLVWEMESGKVLFELEERKRHRAIVYSAVFDPHGNWIVTASKDGTVRVWDARKGKMLLELSGKKGHKGPVRSAAFNHDGTRIVTAGEDKTVRVWDAKFGEMLFELEEEKGHGGIVYSAAFSPDGERIVTASEDWTARVWEARSGKWLATLGGKNGHEDSVRSAAFSPNCKRIVTASKDKTAKVWDWETGKVVLELRHTDWVNSAAFSPDGRFIATACGDKKTRIWGTTAGQKLFEFGRHRGTINGVAFRFDGKCLVTASGDTTARVWELDVEKKLIEIAGDKGHKGSIRRVAFSSRGDRIVTASEDQTACVWDAKTGERLLDLEHWGWVSSAAFSPDGSRVVTSGADAGVRVWDADSGRLLVTLRGHTGWVYQAAFSPLGDRILTAGKDETARIWDAARGNQLLALEGHRGRVSSAAFDPKGERVITAGEDGTARIWNATTGKELLKFGGQKIWLSCAAFNPRGDRVVTAGEDGIARVWDADSGRLLVTLRGHTGWVYSAAFNPRGDRVVTAGEDGTTRVWDADSGRRLVTLRGHTGWVYSAVFSPDGNKIVTASEDKTVRISGFELCCPFEVLLISARYIRDLTEEERERYLYQVRQRPEEVDPGSIGILARYI